jgi:hypothetical protein
MQWTLTEKASGCQIQFGSVKSTPDFLKSVLSKVLIGYPKAERAAFFWEKKSFDFLFN